MPARHTHGGGFKPVLPGSWQILNIGGGGLNVNVDINPSDGTLLSWSDVFGPWASNISHAGGNGNWIQPATAASMPFPQTSRQFFTGVYAMKSCPTNSNVVVMIYNGNTDGSESKVLVSRNKMANWAITNIGALPGGTNLPGPGSGLGGAIVFNPADESKFLVGIPGFGGTGNGLWYCTNYGANCTRIDSGGSGLLPTTTTSSYLGMDWQGNNIMIGVGGVGCYLSTNGIAGPFSAAPAGGPTGVRTGAFATDGTYFCLNDTDAPNIWRLTNAFSSGTWLNFGFAGNFVYGLGLDPNNKDRLVAILADSASHTTSNFKGWIGVTTNATTATPPTFIAQTSFTVATGDTPWIATAASSSSSTGAFTYSGCAIDGTGRLWVGNGVGVFNVSPIPSINGGSFVYTPMCQGIEGLEINQVRWLPGGPVMASAWDRPIWVISNPNTTQAAYYPTAAYTQSPPPYGEGIDFAQDGSKFMVGQSNSDIYFSNDVGMTWTKISGTSPLSALNMAVAVFTSSIWCVIDTASGAGNASMTTDGGATFSAATGLPAGGFAASTRSNTQCVCWDTVTAGTGYAVSVSGATAGNVYSTTNSGALWSVVGSLPISSGLAGASRLKAVPGKAGHLFFVRGNPNSGTVSPTDQFYFSSDGGGHWSIVTNASYLPAQIWDIGFSAAPPGHTYPSIALYGYIQSPTTGGNYVIDVWRCDNFDAGIAGMVWMQMNWTWVAEVCSLAGNPNVYNQWITGCNGPGGNSSGMGCQFFGPNGLMFH